MKLNCRGKSKPDERDHKCPMVAVSKKTIDYRRWNRIAENQGFTQSCTMNGCEGMIQVPINIIRQTDIKDGTKMIDLDAIQCFNDMCNLYYGGDNTRGAYPRDAVKYMQKYGMTEISPHGGSKHKLLRYWRCNTSDEIINSLLYCGPCTVAVKWFSCFNDIQDFLPEPQRYHIMSGYHQMSVEGYIEYKGKMAFVIRNSYGMEWGMDGYCFITQDLMDKIMVESYGSVYDGHIDEMAILAHKIFIEDSIL